MSETFLRALLNKTCYELMHGRAPRVSHVGNRIFLRAFLNKTCYELMHGRAPRVSLFRAFGCRCFILKKGRLDKFESRSSDGIFLGYASHSRAFRVLNLDTSLVMQTCEVTFDETQP
jgi:hypothetical protein